MLLFSTLEINPPDTFGGIAHSILNQIMGYSGNVMNFVADKSLTLSIKDIQHIDRYAVSATYKISGPSQKRPTGWTVALKDSSIKESLINFFVKSWKNGSLAPFFNGKVLYTNTKDTWYKFEPQDDRYFVPSK